MLRWMGLAPRLMPQEIRFQTQTRDTEHGFKVPNRSNCRNYRKAVLLTAGNLDKPEASLLAGKLSRMMVTGSTAPNCANSNRICFSETLKSRFCGFQACRRGGFVTHPQKVWARRRHSRCRLFQ